MPHPPTPLQQAVALSTTGCYATDYYQDRVLKFSPTGTFLWAMPPFGRRRGNGDGEVTLACLLGPHSIGRMLTCVVLAA